MFAKATVLRDVMEKEVLKSPGGTADLHMHTFTMAAALDILGVTALGVDFDSLRNPNQLILEAYRAVFPSLEKQTLLQKLLGAALPAVLSPHLLFKLPLPRIKRFHWGMAILRDFCVDEIRVKKREIAKSGGADDAKQKGMPSTVVNTLGANDFADILSAIIASGMTDETELVSHLLTILAAG
jgi:hypothetical protein